MSVLITPGISGNVPAYSVLFVVWALSCQVLVNLYLGKMTSFVISPQEPEVMSGVQSLVDRNYTLLFHAKRLANFVKSFEITNLENFIDSARLLPENRMFHSLALETNVAVVLPWPLAIKALSAARKVAMERGKNCFSGKHLVVGQPSQFCLFLTPKHSRVFESFKRFEEAGIYELWTVEYIKLVFANRVQDRLRVITPTKMVEEVNVERLKLKGKLLQVFLLLGLCCIVSGFCFLVEIFWWQNLFLWIY